MSLRLCPDVDWECMLKNEIEAELPAVAPLEGMLLDNPPSPIDSDAIVKQAVSAVMFATPLWAHTDEVWEKYKHMSLVDVTLLLKRSIDAQSELIENVTKAFSDSICKQKKQIKDLQQKRQVNTHLPAAIASISADLSAFKEKQAADAARTRAAVCAVDRGVHMNEARVKELQAKLEQLSVMVYDLQFEKAQRDAGRL